MKQNILQKLLEAESLSQQGFQPRLLRGRREAKIKS